ncbi:MAG: C-GCAxxG-C-C family protein [Eubacteriales bacterium]|nr:C-GCAxxG-C-C family protein [Eubacteriales bacterium]
MTEHEKVAQDLFNQGCNCAQASFAPFAADAELSQDQALRIASAFGGGIAKSGNLCGALSGALMAAGVCKGYGLGVTPEEKSAFADQMKELYDRFEAEFSSVMCHELKAKNEQDIADGKLCPEGKACMRYVLFATKLAEEFIEK